jgi:hypothetical protein
MNFGVTTFVPRCEDASIPMDTPKHQVVSITEIDYQFQRDEHLMWH